MKQKSNLLRKKYRQTSSKSFVIHVNVALMSRQAVSRTELRNCFAINSDYKLKHQ